MGLGGKTQILRKLKRLGINKIRNQLYDDLLDTISCNKTNMYKVKRPFKHNHHLWITTKTFESCLDKSKIRVQRQSEPNEILYQDIFIQVRKAKTGSKHHLQTMRNALLNISHCNSRQ